jgi:hypothetical protein
MCSVPGLFRVLLSVAICAIPCFSQTSRPFQLAASAIQAYTQDRGIIFRNSGPGFTFHELAADVDVISVQPEYLGVPFASFANGPDLPEGDPWAKQMSDLANAANEAGKPLMVQIALTRTNMVGNAIYPEGLVQVQPHWAPSCVDLTRPEYDIVPRAYVNYALWVARTFTPKYFVIMLEPNLYFANCGGDTPTWKLLVKIERDVYRAVKDEFPSMLLFPSFNLEAIYGFAAALTGFDQTQYMALLGMKRDRLGLVSFPQLIGNPYRLPTDYYTRILDRNPNEPKVVITETGWNSGSFSFYDDVNDLCATHYSEPSFEEAFLEFVMYSGYLGEFDLITWWSARDEFPSGVVNTCYPVATPPDYAACNDDVWCAAINAARAAPPPGATPELGELALKAFGGMGLREYDGTPKAGALSLWQRFQQLPISNGPGRMADSGRAGRR